MRVALGFPHSNRRIQPSGLRVFSSRTGTFARVLLCARGLSPRWLDESTEWSLVWAKKQWHLLQVPAFVNDFLSGEGNLGSLLSSFVRFPTVSADICPRLGCRGPRRGQVSRTQPPHSLMGGVPPGRSNLASLQRRESVPERFPDLSLFLSGAQASPPGHRLYTRMATSGIPGSSGCPGSSSPIRTPCEGRGPTVSSLFSFNPDGEIRSCSRALVRYGG